MRQNWSKWTQCKNKPRLEGYTLEDTEIHHLGYKTVVIDHYDKGRWDLSGKAIQCITEYDKEEWNELQKSQDNLLRLQDNAKNLTQ